MVNIKDKKIMLKVTDAKLLNGSVNIEIRAATNDYFDNWIVGQLFFRLIELKTFFFYWQKNTLLHILSNVFQTNMPTEWYTYST